MAILRPEDHDRMVMESVSFAKEEAKRRLQAPVQIKAQEIRSQFRNNSHLYLVDPRLGFNHRTFRFWINRIPAGEEEGMGWKTLGHRHTVEAVLHVLQGTGHSIIDGVRYDWSRGDVLCIPVFSWHQHFNTGDMPARFLVHHNRPLMENLGFMHVEQGEWSNEE